MATAAFSLSLPPSFGWCRNSLPAHFSVSNCSSNSNNRNNNINYSSYSYDISKFKSLSHIQTSAVIACLRAKSKGLAVEAGSAAFRGGISVLEIVMSTPGVFEVIEELISNHPTSIIGAGTVLNADDARNAVKAGAKFLMSPVFVKEILDDLRSTEVLYIPGAMTPTEILNAYNAGAEIVKVYPASALGGAQYIGAIKKLFFHIPMVASQGISIDSVGLYIAQGASAVVLSDAIFDKEAMRQRNFGAIQKLAHLSTLCSTEAIKRKSGDNHLRTV